MKCDIIVVSVGNADFLCLHDSPLVCVDKLTAFPTDRRTRAFLSEVKDESNAKR